jgi:hypothetical protein
MVIAALVTFAILLIGWLIAPGEPQVAPAPGVPMEGHLAEAA